MIRNASACEISYLLPLCVKKLRHRAEVLAHLLPFARIVRWLRTFHSRGNFHVASSVRNLTEIGLEIPREGRVNFRHLAVPSARRQKSYFRRKSSYLERTTKRSHPPSREPTILSGKETRFELRLSQTWPFNRNHS